MKCVPFSFDSNVLLKPQKVDQSTRLKQRTKDNVSDVLTMTNERSKDLPISEIVVGTV